MGNSVTNLFRNVAQRLFSRNGAQRTIFNFMRSLNRAEKRFFDGIIDRRLTQAARRGDIDAIKRISSNKWYAHLVCQNGEALLAAVTNGHLHAVEELTARWTAFHTHPWDHSSWKQSYKDACDEALTIAAREGRADIVKVLLKNARKRRRDYLSNPERWEGFSKALFYSVVNGHAEIVEELVSRGANVNYKDGLIVKYAVAGGNAQIIQAVSSEDSLWEATYKGQTSAVEALIDAGTKIQNIETYRNYYHHVLLDAVKNGHTAIVKAILKTGGIAASDAWDLLSVASGHGYGHGQAVQPEMFRTIAESGIYQGRDKEGNEDQTLLGEIAEKGYAELIQPLVTAGANPNTARCIALFRAADNGQVDAFKALLRVGADPLTHWGANGIRNFAVRLDSKGHKEIAGILNAIRAEAVRPTFKTQSDTYGTPPGSTAGSQTPRVH